MQGRRLPSLCFTYIFIYVYISCRLRCSAAHTRSYFVPASALPPSPRPSIHFHLAVLALYRQTICSICCICDCDTRVACFVTEIPCCMFKLSRLNAKQYYTRLYCFYLPKGQYRIAFFCFCTFLNKLNKNKFQIEANSITFFTEKILIIKLFVWNFYLGCNLHKK